MDALILEGTRSAYDGAGHDIARGRHLPMAVPDELPATMPDQDLGLPSLAGLRRRTLHWLARRALQASM